MDTSIVIALIGGLATVLAAITAAIATFRGKAIIPRSGRIRIRNVRGIEVVKGIDPRHDLRASIYKDDLAHLTNFLHAVDSKLKECSYEPECLDAISATLVELARNAFIYGCTDKAQMVEFRLTVSATVSTLWVANAKGVMFTAGTDGTPVLPPRPLPADDRGRGIFFCREHSDWLHLVNAPDRGIVEAGFFRERVRFSERSITDEVTVLGVSTNSANPSISRRTVQEIDRLLALGQSIVIECAGTTIDTDYFLAEEQRRARFNLDSDFLISIINRYSDLEFQRVVFVGPAAFKSLFEEFTYAATVEEAVKVIKVAKFKSKYR